MFDFRLSSRSEISLKTEFILQIKILNNNKKKNTLFNLLTIKLKNSKTAIFKTFAWFFIVRIPVNYVQQNKRSKRFLCFYGFSGTSVGIRPRPLHIFQVLTFCHSFQLFSVITFALALPYASATVTDTILYVLCRCSLSTTRPSGFLRRLIFFNV